MATKKVTTVKGFVAKAQALLNTDNNDNLQSFSEQVVKNFKTAIEKLEQNKNILEIEYKNKRADLLDRIADAKDDLEVTWITVQPNLIKNREMQKSYVVTYLANIETAERSVIGLSKQLEDTVEEYDNALQNINNQIEAYNDKLTKFNNL